MVKVIKTCLFDTAIPLQFYQNKIHDLSFKVTLDYGQTLYCRSKFKIDDPSLEFSTPIKSTETINIERFYIYEGSNFFSNAFAKAKFNKISKIYMLLTALL